MNIQDYSQKEQELLTCIDQFVEDAHLNSDQPPTIKKNELEAFLEAEAKRLSIEFQKDSNSITTNYTFLLEKQNVQLELFYRYKSFYTRHSINPVKD